MALLKEDLKNEIRFQKGSYIFYEPTKEKDKKILQIIKENSKIDGGLNVEVELSIKLTRVILNELTNVEDADSWSDEELDNILFRKEGTRDQALLGREIENYIRELVEDIQYEYFKTIQMGSSLVKTLEGVQEAEKVKTKLDTLLKKNGIVATLDEINAVKDNPEELEKLLTPKAKGKGKRKTSPKKK